MKRICKHCRYYEDTRKFGAILNGPIIPNTSIAGHQFKTWCPARPNGSNYHSHEFIMDETAIVKEILNRYEV